MPDSAKYVKNAESRNSQNPQNLAPFVILSQILHIVILSEMKWSEESQKKNKIEILRLAYTPLRMTI